MSATPIKEELDKSLARSAEYLQTFRRLRQRAKLEEKGQKFRTSLEMEAAHQGWLEQRARHAELHRAYMELKSYD